MHSHQRVACRFTSLLVLLAVAGLLGSCGRGPPSGQSPVTVQPPTQADKRPVGATGVPIDPTKKKVAVVTPAPSGAAAQAAMGRLQKQSKVTQAELAQQITRYTGNMSNPKVKEQLARDMSDRMEVYKHQAVDLYKLQRAAAQTDASANSTQSRD